ncbi:adenine phosphoribosyltransferase [Effusibacillus pohliae]|uniref:adenine phosphoribosyltransferase n=1 Tax=Effusibacillus pohliae TaxID=232270 RepID=UPI0003796B18|nr:adenine phosphoribosyltransferase [Effusibacillus pohliae]
MNLKEKIRVIPDFPEPGIRFKDITTLLQDGEAFKYAIDQMAQFAQERRADLIAGPEARGFVLAAPLAYATGLGFIPIRKAGKLPGETVSVAYELEYGKDKLEIHRDAIRPGQRVVIADDLLATGGTISSTIKLVEELGGVVVGLAFMIELTYLPGREKLQGYDVFTLVQY